MPLRAKFTELFARASRKHPRIAVIGDLMLDEHVQCEVVGLSPEDDLAYKLKVLDKEYKPGGAANVADNLVSLGADVFVAGVVGCDSSGETLKSILETRYHNICKVFMCPDRPTTHKTRYLTPRGRHVARIDAEEVHPISQGALDGIWYDLTRFKPDLVVISDYAKGVVSDMLLDLLWGSRIPYVVDPKKKPFTKYLNAKVITPNLSEFRQATGSADEDVGSVMSKMNPAYKDQFLLVKMGKLGAKAWQASANDLKLPTWNYHGHYTVRPRDVGDPTGCGDSLIAGLAFAWAVGGLEPAEIFRIAVAAGACAFDHVGVYSVTAEDLRNELSSHPY